MAILNRLYHRMQKWLMNEASKTNFVLADFQRIRQEVKSCDVLLIEGRSHIADVIKTITQSRWSHAALYIGRLHDIEDPLLREKIKQCFDAQPSTQLIVESQLGMGTVIRPLHIYEHKNIRICRPKELSYADAQTVISYCIHRLGTDYDVRQILDLARFYFPWSILPRHFRSSLFRWQPGGCTKTVCSTMLAEAFGLVQFPILPLVKIHQDDPNKIRLFQRNPMLCTPSDFDYSPYFDIIKYPYMDFSNNNDPRYRLMPWEGDIDLTQEESKHYMAASKQSDLPDTQISRHLDRPTPPPRH